MKTTYRCKECGDAIEIESYPHMSRKDEYEAEVPHCKRCFEALEDKVTAAEVSQSDWDDALYRIVELEEINNELRERSADGESGEGI